MNIEFIDKKKTLIRKTKTTRFGNNLITLKLHI